MGVRKVCCWLGLVKLVVDFLKGNMILKTGIIGLGPHGRRWFDVALTNPNLEIIGLVDSNSEKLKLIEEVFPKFTTIDELLKETSPDVVIVATHGPSHSEIAIKCIGAGVKYLLIEKPMACSVAECVAMETNAALYSARMAIGKINRHDPLYVFLKEKIKNREWGQLRSIYIQKPGIGLGCLGTHSFDLLTFLLDDFPSTVTGWLDDPIGVNPRGKQFVDPGGLVVLEFANTKVRAVVSQIEDGAGPPTMELHFTDARVFHDPKNNFIDVRIRDRSVKPGPGIPAAYKKMQIPDDLNIKGNMITQMRELLNNLISDQEIVAAPKYGRIAVEVLVAAYVSHNKGNTPVHLPLKTESEIQMYIPVT